MTLPIACEAQGAAGHPGPDERSGKKPMPSRSLVISLAVRLVILGAGVAAIAPAFGAVPR